MKINNVKMKDEITNSDLAKVIETAVMFVIRKNENNEIEYTPYYREYGIMIGIFKYILEGIEYNNDDSILDMIDNNEEISKAISEITNDQSYMDFITENVYNIVAFRKQQYLNDFSEIKKRLLKSIHQEQAVNEHVLKLAKQQSAILSQQMKAGEYNEKIMELTTPEEAKALNDKLLSGEFDMQKIANIAIEKYLESEIHKTKEKEFISSKAADITE
ncbi:MAG: hypothetical protein ACOYBL_08890 [Lachnospiraceae bacterium]|jgi:uncharacterized protein (UPF0262 family)